MDDATSRRTRWVGIALISLGGLHTVATLGGAGDVVRDMLAAGWWRSADPMDPLVHPMQVAVFWSLMFGGMLALLGGSLLSVAAERPPSRAWALGFAALCLVGAIAVPIGGFWIGLGFALWMAIRAG